MTVSPLSSTSPYMFTWPRPGIQIGSCIRSTPGATSVISSDAGSCSCFGGRGRACGCVSVTFGRLAIGHRGEFWPRTIGFGDRAASEHEFFVVAPRDDLQTDGQAVGRHANR